jgi:hypothetical protein
MPLCSYLSTSSTSVDTSYFDDCSTCADTSYFDDCSTCADTSYPDNCSAAADTRITIDYLPSVVGRLRPTCAWTPVPGFGGSGTPRAISPPMVGRCASTSRRDSVPPGSWWPNTRSTSTEQQVGTRFPPIPACLGRSQGSVQVGMVDDDGSLSSQSGPRVTRVGAIVRALSIDEFPQLFKRWDGAGVPSRLDQRARPSSRFAGSLRRRSRRAYFAALSAERDITAENAFASPRILLVPK